MTTTYRIDKTYDWNYEHGPQFKGPWPEIPETPMKDFFGVPVASRFGVAAGLLLNSGWIETYAKLGFDILTYKTVRPRERKCQELPNWVYIDRQAPLGADASEPVTTTDALPENHEAVTSAVSYGMPSKSPDVWQPDVRAARRRLGEGKALVVSVVASPESEAGEDAIVEEFALLAALARDAGAQVIEANLSCPNVCTPEGSLYLDPALAGRIALAMRRSAGKTPLTLKAGYFKEEATLAAFLAAVDGHVDGVVLVNGISRPVVKPDGSPAFGPGRETVGVLGRSIHEPSLGNVRRAVELIEEHDHALKVIAVGGVLSAADMGRYFDAGAYAVMMGGAPMFQPELAVRIKQEHPDW